MDPEQEKPTPQGPPPPDFLTKPATPPSSIPAPGVAPGGPPEMIPPPPKPEPASYVEETLPPGSLAPINTRLLAFVIDALVAVGINLLLLVLLPDFLDRKVAALALFGYIIVRDCLPLKFLGGQSVGKKVMNIQAVTLDGKSLEGNWEPGLIRNAVLVIPFFAIVELVVLFTRDDKPQRGYRLGDEWAKTKVITVAPSIPTA